MNTQFDKLSQQGAELVVNAITFRAGVTAASKALGDINRERKAALKAQQEEEDGITSNDAAAELDDELAGEQSHDANTEALGFEPPASFADWCYLFAAGNERLETLAAGGTWPKPIKVDYIAEYKTRAQRPSKTAVAAAVESIKAMVQASTGKTITDADALPLAEDEVKARNEYFAQAFTVEKEEIVARMEAGVTQYAHNAAEFESVFNNMPERVKVSLIAAADRALQFKIQELQTGVRFNGQPSPAAKIPTMARAGMVAELRGDQQTLKGFTQQLAHAVAA